MNGQSRMQGCGQVCPQVAKHNFFDARSKLQRKTLLRMVAAQERAQQLLSIAIKEVAKRPHWVLGMVDTAMAEELELLQLLRQNMTKYDKI